MYNGRSNCGRLLGNLLLLNQAARKEFIVPCFSKNIYSFFYRYFFHISLLQQNLSHAPFKNRLFEIKDPFDIVQI